MHMSHETESMSHDIEDSASPLPMIVCMYL